MSPSVLNYCKTLLVILMAFASAGCIPSFKHGLGPEEDAIVESRLVGWWQPVFVEETTEMEALLSVRLRHQNSKELELTFSPRTGFEGLQLESGSTCRVFKFNNVEYVNIYFSKARTFLVYRLEIEVLKHNSQTQVTVFRLNTNMIISNNWLGLKKNRYGL